MPAPACRSTADWGDWLHEIKHDGFRIMARRDAAGVRLLTRNGYDFAGRFPLAAAAVAALSARSCLIDGEAIVTDQKGLAVFDLIRGRQPSAAAVLCAFDLLELDGEDLRREPIETRKSTLKSLLRGKHAGIAFNAHFIADGAIVYRQACALGCEGIVSKRLGSSVSLRSRRLLGEGQEPGRARGRTAKPKKTGTEARPAWTTKSLAMCGRFTNRLTWEELVRLCRLQSSAAAQSAASVQYLPRRSGGCSEAARPASGAHARHAAQCRSPLFGAVVLTRMPPASALN